ncbi:MAG: LysR family transcriptional regulator [Sphingomonas sp.]
MEQQSPRNPPPVAPGAAGLPHPPCAPPIRAHWTPARQRIFLAALLETGSVARAARAAGMSRSSAYGLRERMAGTPFDRAWDQVLVEHARRLADPLAPDSVPAAPARRAPVASPARG